MAITPLFEEESGGHPPFPQGKREVAITPPFEEESSGHPLSPLRRGEVAITPSSVILLSHTAPLETIGSIGSLETIKKMPGYEKALEKLKNEVTNKDEQAKKVEVPVAENA